MLKYNRLYAIINRERLGVKMDTSNLITIITFFVTLILGCVSKRNKFISNNLIPIQNMVIGIIAMVVDYIITKDITTAIAFSGIAAGGTYDIIHNLNKIEK